MLHVFVLFARMLDLLVYNDLLGHHKLFKESK